MSYDEARKERRRLSRERDEAEAETRRELRRNRKDLEEATGGSEEGEREGK